MQSTPHSSSLIRRLAEQALRHIYEDLAVVVAAAEEFDISKTLQPSFKRL